ncbi:MAG: oxygen-dependent coproporphyrinogen oxidase [Candidatus Dadabacteria bacterium]|nr:MAG: oxygen-dependent coproporphyrinogen oxidase [Candidatus Dadabacteria bacterium]
MTDASQSRKDRVSAAFRRVQDDICDRLAAIDGQAFREDQWTYERGKGGGRTRVLEDGGVFEKGGVNYSALAGDELPPAALAQIGRKEGLPFFATGVSLVIHPRNPHIPTVHMNIRYFEAGEQGDIWWFGGGIDLTPYYPRFDDVVAFHRTLRDTCERFDETWYPRFKQHCDEYFYLPHRGETRGVGGIFFDHLQHDFERSFDFTVALGDTFLPAYVPIVLAHRDEPYGEREREFQLIRRGRYVEFNLLFDRGTKFGIESNGRTESILMSLPTLASWRYDWHPEPGSPEAALWDYLRPRDWLSEADQT